MSDTGEQGLKPQDPADQAGVGGGIVPDDQSEGYAQVSEAADAGIAAKGSESDEKDEDGAAHPSDHSAGD